MDISVNGWAGRLDCGILIKSTGGGSCVAGLAVNRYEYKYLVSAQDHQMIGRLLSEVLARDPHAGADGTYVVRSLYFDTPVHAGYHAKIDGLEIGRASCRERV